MPVGTPIISARCLCNGLSVVLEGMLAEGVSVSAIIVAVALGELATNVNVSSQLTCWITAAK